MIGEPTTNFLFQAINGSGKTGSYAVPSLMKVDKSLNKVQVIILANTRELIRQIYQVMEIIGSETGIKLMIGEAGAKIENC